jgi:hypothetical protein
MGPTIIPSVDRRLSVREERRPSWRRGHLQRAGRRTWTALATALYLKLGYIAPFLAADLGLVATIALIVLVIPKQSDG